MYKKIWVSFFILVFLINSTPLLAWAAVADDVVEFSQNSKVELGSEEEMYVNEDKKEDLVEDFSNLDEEVEEAEEEIVGDSLELEEEVSEDDEDGGSDDEEEVDVDEDDIANEENNESDELDDSEEVSDEESDDEESIDESEDESLIIDEEDSTTKEEIVPEIKEEILEGTLKEIENLEILNFGKIKKGEAVENLETSSVEEIKTASGVDYTGVIFINEIMVDSSDDNKEWVELYNAGDEDINLTGWKIKDLVNASKDLVNDNAVDEGNVIPAGGFYIFHFFPSSNFGNKGWLNNDASSNEEVTIFDPSENIVDNVKVKPDFADYPDEDETVGRSEDGIDDWVLFDVKSTTQGYNNAPMGTIIFQSYICASEVGDALTNNFTKNDYKPNSSGDVVGDLSKCNAVGGYNIGHGDDAVALPVPEAGTSVGVTDGDGSLEISIKARNKNYIFGQLDENDKWIGFDDPKVYSEDILGFACTDSSDGGLRDNNAEAFVVTADVITYCNLYVADNTAPEIILEFPVDGDVISGDIQLRATCNEDCDYINFWWRKDSQSYSNVSPDRRYHYEFTDGTEFGWILDSLDAERWGNDPSYVMEDGIYYFYAAGKDLYGNWAKSNEIYIVVDNTAPVVTINEIGLTNDNSPGLSGTVDDVNATVLVTVNGNDYIAINNGDGTWILSDDTISPELADGVYDVVVTATDEVGNEGYDTTVDEVIIDATAPVLTEEVSIDSPTNDTTPEYTFNSIEAGNIIYGGDCSSLTSKVIVGDNVINFDELADGVYSNCTVTVVDEAGNGSEALNVSDFIVDTTKPTANQLTDQFFNEGDDVPLMTVTGEDVIGVQAFCFNVVDENGNEFVSETCDDSGVGVSYDWNTSFGFTTIFDTTLVPEGNYTINYYVEDLAGNKSDDYSFVYTVNNVAPTVSFSVDDNNIDEDDTASFIGSFTDPSTKDAGDNSFDDANWYVYINYGEGDDIYLGSFTNESLINIPDHKYKHDGDFVAALTVCESKTNVSSEHACTTQQLNIEVDDKDDDDDKKDKADNEDDSTETIVYYDNNANSYYDSNDEQIVEENNDDKSDVEASKNDNKKDKKVVKESEIKGVVAGDQSCQDSWSLWAWVLLVVAFALIASLIGRNAKTKDENIQTIFWQAIILLVSLVIWYFADSCRSFVWVTVVLVVSELVIVTIFYKSEEQV